MLILLSWVVLGMFFGHYVSSGRCVGQGIVKSENQLYGIIF